MHQNTTQPDSEEDLVVDEAIKGRLDDPWKVILFNDEIHSFDEVILQLIKALGCGEQRATEIALEAHLQGKALALVGSFAECFRVVSILREIQLIVEIEG